MNRTTMIDIFASTTNGSTQCGGSRPKGRSHPPRNTVVTTPETMSMLMYSAK
jgi:hypothetical protein